MRIRLLAVLPMVFVLLAAACQPDPTLTQNGRLMSAASPIPENALPTLFLPPTSTPVIVPTGAMTLPPTEIADLPVATAQSNVVVVTPTRQPSKTPTITPTQTAVPTITPTATITITPTQTATSSQFAFSGARQSSAAEATAYALNLQAAGQRADERDAQQVSAQNAFVLGNTNANAQQAPAADCPEQPWFFAGITGNVCPSGRADGTNAAFQRFQYGYMLWLQDNNQIYAIYNNTDMPRWESFPNSWHDGMAECDASSALNIANRQGWTPIQGFCMVWVQNPNVGNRLGLSEDRYEYSYVARYQFGEDNSLAFEDNEGSVFYLRTNGDWTLWRR